MSFSLQLKHRTQRLILTLLSKQWLGFFIATWLRWNDCITSEIWGMAFGIVVGANIVQKKMGVENVAAAVDK